jgi:microcystin degradation protein MlrC
MSWDWNGQDVPDLGLALGAASWAVGLPLAPPASQTVCDSSGQGRSVVALWLAAQATPETEEALRLVAARQATGRLMVVRDGWDGALALGRAEIAHVLALLERPREDVAAAVAQDWHLLTDPSATTEEVANRLGLAAVSEVAAAGGAGPFDPETVSPDLRLGPACGRAA